MPADATSLTTVAEAPSSAQNVFAFWQWAFEAANEHTVAGWGFWLAVGGLLLTIGGFSLTWQQIRRTKTAAEAAQQEAKRIQRSLKKHDAAQEISRAKYALLTARKHFGNSAWDDGAESYEDFGHSLSVLSKIVDGLNAETTDRIQKAILYVNRICTKVDKMKPEQVPFDKAKTRAVMREQGYLISEIADAIEEAMF